jgi:hypothetical protein
LAPLNVVLADSLEVSDSSRYVLLCVFAGAPLVGLKRSFAHGAIGDGLQQFMLLAFKGGMERCVYVLTFERAVYSFVSLGLHVGALLRLGIFLILQIVAILVVARVSPFRQRSFLVTEFIYRTVNILLNAAQVWRQHFSDGVEERHVWWDVSLLLIFAVAPARFIYVVRPTRLIPALMREARIYREEAIERRRWEHEMTRLVFDLGQGDEDACLAALRTLAEKLALPRAEASAFLDACEARLTLSGQ